MGFRRMPLMLLCLFFLFGKITTLFAQQDTEIRWYTWEEGIELQQKNPRKVFIDIYTEWCIYCIKMDTTTFKTSDVITFMNDHFLMIKLDAEVKKPLIFKGNEYGFIHSRKKGFHELAFYLLDGKLAYPSYVILDDDLGKLGTLSGYKESTPFISAIRAVLSPDAPLEID